MTILEATVEIVKSMVGSASSNTAHLLTVDKSRESFLEGVEKLYNKLEELDKNNLKR